uniref:Uncharacterized protein n=1 Tax=Trichogramma kaykai TaxID=54128 RepID=A0ABD2XKP7_9HYME
MSRKRKRQSSPCHVSYEIDTSKKAYDDIITFPNPDVSGSDASDFDTYWGDEISDLTYKKTSKTYTETQTKLEKNHVFD